MVDKRDKRPSELGEIVGLGHGAVKRMIYAGEIPSAYKTPGGHWRIPYATVEEFERLGRPSISEDLPTLDASHSISWGRFNHSKSDITLALVDAEQEFWLDEADARNPDVITTENLLDILHDHYSEYINTVREIHVVEEDSATWNFRVSGEEQEAILLRVNKRLSTEGALDSVQAIQKHILDRRCIFGDSRLSVCLKPLVSSSGHPYEVFYGASRRRPYFIEAYVFAENVRHFPGESEGQLRSVAKKYGEVQNALQELDTSINLNVFRQFHGHQTWTRNTLRRRFAEVSSHVKWVKTEPPNNPDYEFADLFENEELRLNVIFEQIQPEMARSSGHEGVLLHEFHPHNTFFEDLRGSSCLLIYDFETVMEASPHTTILAATMHRFIREYYPLHISREPFKDIPKIVRTFLDDYSSGGMDLPDDFIKRMHLGIKIFNFAKLLGVLSYQFLKSDPNTRERQTRLDETRKFIAYLREAEYFNSQVWQTS